jgi:hypothetical protein
MRMGQLGRDRTSGFASSAAVKSWGGRISGGRVELRRLLGRYVALACCVLWSGFTSRLSCAGDGGAGVGAWWLW